LLMQWPICEGVEGPRARINEVRTCDNASGVPVEAASNPTGMGGISVDGVDIALCQPAAAEEIAIAASAEEPGDRELVRRAQEGDVTAFEQLYRANVRRVYAICYRFAGDAPLAEELAQDVFVRAWEKLGTFRGDSAFASWLFPVAVNVALSALRSRRPP